ncbi:Helitron helicase [Phytophthora megakarya]|uniref:Helitron helicase n=1 Tax=Phytophthora megakarya TaxID=4795 RepID=A0A225WHX3_9STRA|nr:Helitron helicase [Phytophthora megakarya]
MYNTDSKWYLQLSSAMYVCHCMGSLLPPPNRRRMYAQVCINDPDMQARVASRLAMADGLDKGILETIGQVMTTHNTYTAVEEFTHRDRAGEARPEDNPVLRLHKFLPEYEKFKLRLHVARNANPGTNNTPTAFEVAGIIIDRGTAEHRDFILHHWQEGLERFFERRASYDPLQYPLLFPHT